MDTKNNKAAAKSASEVKKEVALPLDLNNFRLDQLTFEARMAPALLLWDRAGEIWRSFMVSQPNLKLKHAQPDKTEFVIDSKYEIGVELRRVVITGFGLSNTPDEKFTKIANELVNVAVKMLEVEVFDRVGVRSIFFRQFQSDKEAEEALLSTNLLSTPRRQHFGINETPTSIQFLLRWEDDVKGTLVRAVVESRTLNIDLPLQVVNSELGERFVKPAQEVGIVFDADSYTKKPIKVGQFRAQDFISQSLQTVINDGTLLLQGK